MMVLHILWLLVISLWIVGDLNARGGLVRCAGTPRTPHTPESGPLVHLTWSAGAQSFAADVRPAGLYTVVIIVAVITSALLNDRA